MLIFLLLLIGIKTQVNNEFFDFFRFKKKSILFDNTNEFINTFQNNYHNIDSWYLKEIDIKLFKILLNNTVERET